MATLSQDLQNYLTKSDTKVTSFKFDTGGLTNWFNGANYSRLPTGETGNDSRESSWFGDSAEADRCLPSMFGRQIDQMSQLAYGDFLWSVWKCLPLYILGYVMSKKQRIVGFVFLMLMGFLCMGLATLYVPFLILKARKFALLYSLGSLFLVGSFSILWGPMSHIKHLFSVGRLPFTMVYFGTMGATVYFAMVVHSTVLTVIFAVAQVLALVWYIVSYIPGGQRGLQFFSKIFSTVVSKSVSSTLPV